MKDYSSTTNFVHSNELTKLMKFIKAIRKTLWKYWVANLILKYLPIFITDSLHCSYQNTKCYLAKELIVI